MAETFTGTVKFVHETGLLFLAPDDHASSDIFIHCIDGKKLDCAHPNRASATNSRVVIAKRGPRAINPTAGTADLLRRASVREISLNGQKPRNRPQVRRGAFDA
jgi:hypothetical protein